MSEPTPADPVAEIARSRPAYDQGTLERDDLDPDPLTLFNRWMADALESEGGEPYAMVLSTVDGNGAPQSRAVLLRGVDHGLVFFTNRHSAKGQQLAENDRCAAHFLWGSLHRQVGIRGRAEFVSDEESDAYWAGRPHDHQVGSAASRQSRKIGSRAVLERWMAEVEDQYPDEVPRPTHWGGYRIIPDEVEFWQGRLSRAHDRFRYRRLPEAGWEIDRLSP